MSKPLSEWDEDYILSLPKENNEFEKKGSKKLDLTLPGVDENDVLNELAKQLSAFANTGGGKIIYGVKNDGSIDGGVSTEIKVGGTKEWLERQVGVLTDYEILGVGVREFVPGSPNSQIQQGKALYVIDVPDSDRAPHQSRRDYKYYVRLNSQSQPAPHRMIEDIRNRQKHPSVFLSVKPKKLHWPLRQVDLVSGHYAIDVTLTLAVANNGTLKSADTFLLLNPEQGHLTEYYGEEIAATMVRGTKTGHYMWHLNRPLPPQSEISFVAEYHFQGRLTFHPQVGKFWTIFDGEQRLDDVAIEWTVFADSAPPRTNRITMLEIGFISLIDQAMNQHNIA